MFDLRQHQSEALDAITNMFNDDSVQSGRIVIPTGGGKTLVESYALRDRINTDGMKIHLVLAPRIALVDQLIREYRNFIGQNYRAVAFHSGRFEREAEDYKKVRWAETSTTSIDIVQDELKKAVNNGKDLVIFSTYASAHKLMNMQFDIMIADESQYCVTEDYFDTVRDINASKKLFFTATERHTISARGRGLNNEEVFGSVLFQVAPKTLIEKGYIVAPRLHVMTAEAKSQSYTVIDEVINIATKQAELTVDMPVTKILFAMKGTDDVKTITENIDKIKAAMPGFDIFTIVSNAKFGAQINGEKTARGNFMKGLRDSDRAVVFHYDILSEGMDIDGITGVAILRNMKHSKLLQTIGRAVRVYKANPSLKQQAWVSVVGINNDEESIDNVGRTLVAIREGGFDVNVENIVVTDSIGYGIADDEMDIDALTGPDRKNKALDALDAVFHNIERDDMFNRAAALAANSKTTALEELF